MGIADKLFWGALAVIGAVFIYLVAKFIEAVKEQKKRE